MDQTAGVAAVDVAEPPYTDALTERFHSTVDQLVGPGRWEMTQEMGWWPVKFPGFDDPPYAARCCSTPLTRITGLACVSWPNPHSALPSPSTTEGDDLYPVEIPLFRARLCMRTSSPSPAVRAVRSWSFRSHVDRQIETDYGH